MAQDEEPTEEGSLETEQGREEGVESGSLDPREAAFMAGYADDKADEEEDVGLEDDEKLED